LIAALSAAAASIPGLLAHARVPEPEGYRTSDYRAAVPETLAGAEVLDAEGAQALWQSGQAVFIDVYPRPPKPENLPVNTVWRDPVHTTIEGAHWLPNVGYGVLAPTAETYFGTRLAALTGGDKTRRLVFFCQRDCWMSWNAAKRALALGYRNVAWFPEGTDVWEEAGLPLAEAAPIP
jgi:PQQ-dependent catabolism-associated CXXCW motif protein